MPSGGRIVGLLLLAMFFVAFIVIGFTSGIIGFDNDGGEGTQIKFEEKSVGGGYVVHVTLLQFAGEGNLEVTVDGANGTETEVFLSPSDQIQISRVVGDEIPGGLTEGDTISVISIRQQGGGVIATYDVSEEENTVTA